MRDGIRIDAERADLGQRIVVLGAGDGVVEQELGLTLGSVDLHLVGADRLEEQPGGGLLHHEHLALFQTVASAGVGRDHHRATLADADVVSLCLERLTAEVFGVRTYYVSTGGMSCDPHPIALPPTVILPVGDVA